MGVSQLRLRSTPARRPRLRSSSPAVQERAAPAAVLTFDGLLVIVGGGTVDRDAAARPLCRRRAPGRRRWRGGPDRRGGADARGDHRRFRFADAIPTAGSGGRGCCASPSRRPPISKRRSIRRGAPVTVALGMTGKRFDHTLAALDAVTRYARERSHHSGRRGRHRAGADRAVRRSRSTQGERVSVHPLAADPVPALDRAANIRSTGCSWRRASGPAPRTRQARPGVDRAGAGEPPWLLILPLLSFGMIAATPGAS